MCQVGSLPRLCSLWELQKPRLVCALAALRALGEWRAAVRGSETEVLVWPDFLSLGIFQRMNFLNICSSQQELLFLTYLSSSVLP